MTIVTDTTSLLVYTLADERFALPMSAVREVLRWRLPTAIPGTSAMVVGVIHHHGVVLPLLDVRQLLGLAAAPNTRNTRLIVVEQDGIHAGLLSDAVADIVAVENDAVEPLPSSFPATQAQFVGGLFYWNDQVVAVLELAAVFAAITAAPNGA